MILNWETLSRPGPHPHRSSRTSFGPTSSSPVNLSLDSSSPDSEIITHHHQTTTIAEKGASVADQGPVEKHDVSVPDLAGTTTVSGAIAMNAS